MTDSFADLTEQVLEALHPLCVTGKVFEIDAPKTRNLQMMAQAGEGERQPPKLALLCHFYSTYKSRIHSAFKELKENNPPPNQPQNPKGPRLQPFLCLPRSPQRQLNNLIEPSDYTCLQRNKCILKPVNLVFCTWHVCFFLWRGW